MDTKSFATRITISPQLNPDLYKAITSMPPRKKATYLVQLAAYGLAVRQGESNPMAPTLVPAVSGSAQVLPDPVPQSTPQPFVQPSSGPKMRVASAGYGASSGQARDLGGLDPDDLIG